MSAVPPTPVLEVEHLGFAHGAREVLRNWSAKVHAGLTVVLGDEGSGKTTLLELLAGQTPLQAGQVRLLGIDLRHSPQLYRAQVFWVDPRTEAYHTVAASDWLQGQQAFWPAWHAPLAAGLLDVFDLQPHLHKQLHMLSTGSRRKLFLSAAFASGAALTLLDTPFAALDRRSADVLLELLHDASSQDRRAFVLADYEAPALEHTPVTLRLPPA